MKKRLISGFLALTFIATMIFTSPATVRAEEAKPKVFSRTEITARIMNAYERRRSPFLKAIFMRDGRFLDVLSYTPETCPHDKLSKDPTITVNGRVYCRFCGTPR